VPAHPDALLSPNISSNSAYLLRLLDQIRRATMNLPSLDEVVRDAQNEDKCKNCTGPMNKRLQSVLHDLYHFVTSRPTYQFIFATSVPLKIGKKLMMLEVNM
jgi:3-hydroxy-3-methylglutaryl CoA synthase